MKRMTSSLLALLLALSMLIGMVPAALAVGTADTPAATAADATKSVAGSATEGEEETTEPTAYVTVNNGTEHYATLDKAIAAAEPVGGVITYNIYGKVTVGDATSTGENWIQVVRTGITDALTEVQFIGQTDDAEISIVEPFGILAEQHYDVDISYTKLTLSRSNCDISTGELSNITKFFSTIARNKNASENTVTYTSCVFPNGAANNQNGKTVFEKCQFTSTADWSVWACYKGSVTTVSNCQFTGKRGIKMYAEGTKAKGSEAGTLIVNNTTFSISDSGKAAIEIAKPGSVTLDKVSVAGNDNGAPTGVISKKLTDGYDTTGNVTIEALGTNVSGTFNVTSDVADSVKEEFNITAGTFTSEVSSDYCADGFKVKRSEDGNTWGVVESTATDVAKIGTTYYTDLQTAINVAAAANSYKEVTLLKDVTINKTINFAKLKTNGSTELNLDGHTLTCEGDRAILIEAGTLYIKNGTVTSTGLREDQNSTSVIRIGSNNAEYANQTPKLFLSTNAKVVAPGCYGVTIFGSTTVSEGLQVNQSASIEATGPCPAISGQGGANFHKNGQGSKIVILGTVTATQNYAIFHPDNGELNIQQNAVISGKGGIQMCSGTLNIIDSPTITATGKAGFTTIDSGPVYDNTAAITAINRNYPGGAPVVKISGTPTITAEGGDVEHAIYAFTWTKEKDKPGVTSDWTGAGENINISGGTYNKKFSTDYLANGYKLGEQDTDGNYTVEKKMVAQIGENQYPTLEAAINAAADGAEIKLIDDTTENGMDITKGITIDFQNHMLTVEDPMVGSKDTETNAIRFLMNGTTTNTVVLKNGTIYSNKAQILIQNYSNLTLDGMTLDGTDIPLNEKDPSIVRYTLSNNNGNTTIKGSTIKAPSTLGIAFDVCGFSIYPGASVTVENSTINGDIEFSDDANHDLKFNFTSGTLNGKLVASKGAENVKATFGESGEIPAPTGYKWVTNEDGTQSLAKRAEVAQIGETKYETLAEAIKDLKENETLTLLADVENVKYAKADVIDIKLPAGATLDGNGNTISGNIKVNVNAAGGTIKNVTFKDIHDSTALSQAQITKYGFSEDKVGTLSSIYASNLTGKLTITDCTFENVDWEHMQITPKEGAEISITNNIFKISDSETVKEQLRHVHIEMAYSSGKYDCEGKKIKATVTDNQFLDATKEATLGVWWVGKDSTLDLTGNYYADTDAVSITLSDASFNRENHCELIFPARSAADKDVDDLKMVASVDLNEFNSKFYTSLAEAIDVAQAGETIKLLDDCASDRINLEDKDLTVDLNGHTLTSTADYGVMFCAKNGHTITINGKTEGSTLNGTVMVTEKTFGHIVLNGGTYANDKYCPIYINGAVSTDDSTLTVTNAVINATIAGTATQPETGDGAYLAGYSTATFTNTTINAEVTGLEIRAGELTMTDCTVTGGTGEVTETAHGNGATVRNAAIAVSQHTTKKPIKVTITGGTYTGSAAFYQSDVQNTGSKDVNTYIKSGEFNGTVEAKTSGALAISGGTFSAAVKPEYCAEGFIPTVENGKYTVKEGSYVASIGTNKYTTLAEAVEVANDGNTIQLLTDVVLTKQVTIEKKLTLDLNGKTISNSTNIWTDDGINWSLIRVNGKNADVTITGNGTMDAKENDCFDLHIDNGGKLTIENGTFHGNSSVVYIYRGGTLTVNGGTFDLKQKGVGTNDGRYLLNCEDEYFKKGSSTVTVTGGTFEDFDPMNVTAEGASVSYTPEGIGVNYANGKFTAVERMAAQRVGTDGKSVQAYETLADAITAAQSDETVKLLANTELTGRITVANKITLDLAGKTIETNGNMIDITGNLTVTGNGTVNNAVEAEKTNLHTIFGVSENAELTVENGTFTTASAQIIHTKGTATVKGGTFKNTSGEKGVGESGNHAMLTASGTAANLVISNATIEALCEVDAGGIYGLLLESGASMTLNEGNNIHTAYPVVAMNNLTANPESVITINGGTYTSECAKLSEGVSANPNWRKFSTVFYLTGKCQLNISGGTFTAAHAKSVFSIPYTPVSVDLKITNGIFNASEDGDSVVFYTEGVTPKYTYSPNAIAVSGGTFNGTLASFNEKDSFTNFVSDGQFSEQVPEAYCAIGYEPTTEKENGYYTVKAVKGNAYYLDDSGKPQYGYLANLLNATNLAGKTITLIDDVKYDNVVIVPYSASEKVKLDLNGHTLSALGLFGAFGDVIDSKDGAGLLKLSSGAMGLNLAKGNTYLPLYDNTTNASGYRFFSYRMAAVKNWIKGGASYFALTVIFNNGKAYELLSNGAHEAEVYIAVQINGGAQQMIKLSQNSIRQWTDAAIEKGSDYYHRCAVYIGITGVTTQKIVAKICVRTHGFDVLSEAQVTN